MTFASVWDYIIREERIEDFFHAYGPHGEWLELFSKASNYRITEPWKDQNKPNGFLTTDIWKTPDSHKLFLEVNKINYEAVDARCAEFTISEQLIGDFEFVDK